MDASKDVKYGLFLYIFVLKALQFPLATATKIVKVIATNLNCQSSIEENVYH